MDKSYAEYIHDHFDGAGDAVNTWLTGQGLDPLVDWYTGMQYPPRNDSTPYAFWHFAPPDLLEQHTELGQVMGFRVGVWVLICLGAGTSEELQLKVARYVPHVVAAVENINMQQGYNVLCTGWEPAVLADDMPFGIFNAKFTVTGQRARKGVA